MLSHQRILLLPNIVFRAATAVLTLLLLVVLVLPAPSTLVLASFGSVPQPLHSSSNNNNHRTHYLASIRKQQRRVLSGRAVSSRLVLVVVPSTFDPPISTTSSLAMTKHSNDSNASDNNDNNNDQITILGFGSLLSLQSARVTFPTLTHFRLGRVNNHRRVFSHPASIFFKRNIAKLDSLEMSSLSVECIEGHSFVCSVFEVPNEGLTGVVANGGKSGEWIPSMAFLEREEEFEIAMVPYEEISTSSTTSIENNNDCSNSIGQSAAPSRAETSLSEESTVLSINNDDVESPNMDNIDRAPPKQGIVCRRSTDEAYISQWGQDHFQSQYLDYGVKTIWNWGKDSGLRPCPVYLRHCVLASWNSDSGGCSWTADGVGGICYNSFLDETFLVDRKTTIREYLKQYPEIMDTAPPELLKERYGG